MMIKLINMPNTWVTICVCGYVYLNTEDVLSEQNSYYTRLKYNQ